MRNDIDCAILRTMIHDTMAYRSRIQIDQQVNTVINFESSVALCLCAKQMAYN